MYPVGWTPSPAQRSITVATPEQPFVTEAGDQLPHVELAYETWGRFNPSRDNAVLVIHALTGDSHAASHPEIDGDRLGWWEPVVGPGRPIDTDQYFVICANSLGSCYGSTGPRSLDPDGRRYNLRFPPLTVRDLVDAQLRLLDKLGIDRLACAAGASLGGMQILELAAVIPQRVDHAVVIAASGRFHAQGIAYNEIQRRAIMLDPAWRGGEYESDAAPTSGIALARMLGMVTYQSDPAMSARFDRGPARYTAWPAFGDHYDVEGYLHYQGDKLASRFDANTYLYLSRAMDSHDFARGHVGLREAARRVYCRTTFIGVSSDILFPPEHVEATSNALRDAGCRSTYLELESIHGHDAFLKEFDHFAPLLRASIESATPTFPRQRTAVAAD